MHEPVRRALLATWTAAAILCVPMLGRAAELPPPSVVISEVGWAGSTASASDEWLELTNLTDAPIALDGWSVAGAATSNSALAFPAGSVIGAHGTFLISNYDHDNDASTLAAPPDAVTSAVSLSNAALSLVLLDSTGAERDRAGDGGAPFAGRASTAAAPGAVAMTRVSPTVDGTTEDAWADAGDASGFDAGAAERGTPGTAESWALDATVESEPVAESPMVEPEIAAEPVTEPIVETPTVEASQPSSEAATVATDSAEPVTAEVADEPTVEADATNDAPAEHPETVAPEGVESTDEPTTEATVDPVAEEAPGVPVSIPEMDKASEPVEPSAETDDTEPVVETPVETPVAEPTATLVLNEFVSDADEEWIEIVNASNAPVSLAGWSVRDEAGKATLLGDTAIAPGAMTVVLSPAGKLNNDGDTIELVDDAGSVVDEVVYGKGAEAVPKKPRSLARDADGAWALTSTPTQGAANVISQDVPETPTETTDAVDAEPAGAGTEPVTEIEARADEPVATGTGSLRLNEFVSDADEEWVEILNDGDASATLTGWTVRDASGTATPLGDETLAAGQMTVVVKPSGKLNNDGDTLELVDPSGAIADDVTYGTDDLAAPEKTQSLARDANGPWRITTEPTQGKTNDIQEVETTDKKIETTKTDSKDKTSETNSTTRSSTRSSSSSSNSTRTTAAWSGPKTVRLSELYPSTAEGDAAAEFIELENTGDASVNLRGWSVKDASGNAFTFDADTALAPGAVLALPRTRTSIALNNTTETVTLAAPDASDVDAISYEKPTKGSSLVRRDAEWVWTADPSPDEPNAISAAVAVAAGSAQPTVARAAPAVAAAPAASRSVASAASARTRLEGTVLAVPGALGTQVFYLSTAAGGMQVFQNEANFPELSVGDHVVVTGTMSEIRGEPRLKATKTDSIVVTGADALPRAETRDIASLTAADHGRLVRVSGIILSRSGNAAVIEHAGAQLNVRIADGTGIDVAAVARGTEMELTGVLVSASGGLTLLPRSSEDIVTVPDESDLAASAATSSVLAGKDAQANQDRGIASLITAGTLLVLAAYAARKLIPNLSHYAKNRAVRAAASAAR